MIVAVVIPDFVIALERKATPPEKQSPMVVYETKGNKRLVAAMCPTAKRQGVVLGMSKSRAHALCPEALEIDAHPKQYQHKASDLCTSLLVFSDRIEYEVSACLTIWLDLGNRSNTESLTVAQNILTYCRNNFPSLPHIGLAAGRLVSRIAAVTTQKSSVQVVAIGQEKTLLSPLTIQQFQTIKRFQQQCEQLGIRTLSDLGKLPYNAVKTRLGDVGGQLHRLYHGYDRKTIERFTVPLREEATHYFDVPIEDKTIIHNTLAHLSDQLRTQLIKGGVACSEITLTIICDNRLVHTSSRTLRSSIQQTKALCEELIRLLSLLQCDSGIVSLTVHLDQLAPPVPEQLNFFDTLFGRSEPFIDTAVQILAPRHQQTPLFRISVLPENSLVVERNSILIPVSAA